MMAPTPKMCLLSAARSILSYLSQQPADQVVNDHGSKSVAKGLVALVNASDIMACTTLGINGGSTGWNSSAI